MPSRLDTTPPRAHNPRWAIAEAICDGLRRLWGRELQAVGVHGSLAHGDDTDSSDVDLVVVTRRQRVGPQPGTRRVNGIIVDLAVVSAEEYLRQARTLTTQWPLLADQYISTRPLHDPDAWLPRLRDVHLALLAQTSAQVFAACAREAWCVAKRAQAKAKRLAEWHETDSAMLMLAEARLNVALVEGLLTRTYFRDSADAVKKTGVASAHIYELDERLARQASELARHGCPVDGSVDDLLGG